MKFLSQSQQPKTSDSPPSRGTARNTNQREPTDTGPQVAPATELPSQEVLDLVRILLEPPDASVAKELLRDIGKRLKRPVSPLLLADALIRLSPHQRGSRPQERTFVRSALLQRLQQGVAWTAQPIVQPAATHSEEGSGSLPDGTWSWRVHSFSITSADQGRFGVLHLWLKNELGTGQGGQPVAIVLADSERAHTWSPVASAQVSGLCPEGCRGSLATVAVGGEQEILGHLSFPLATESAPTVWGLQVGHHAHFRSLETSTKEQPD